MNKFILTLTLACAAHVAQAQQDTLRLGYCNGEVGTNPGLYTRGAAWTDCAIRLHASELAAYRGCQITGVKAALAARNNTDTLSVWVRETVDGADLARATVVRQGLSGVYNGWNTLLFDQPFTHPRRLLHTLCGLFPPSESPRDGCGHHQSRSGRFLDGQARR